LLERLGGVAVDVFELALAPSFLRAICSNSLVRNIGISKFVANVWLRDTNKNANKTDGWGEFLLVFSMRRENCPEKQKSKLLHKLLILSIF